MGRGSNYPPEVRAGVVRMVAEIAPDYSSQWKAIEAVAQRLGVASTETVRKWVRRAEVDAGQRPGTPIGVWQRTHHRLRSPALTVPSARTMSVPGR